MPAVDDRLVVPETRYEMYDGELVHVSPANEAHGTRHSMILTLIEIHARRAFQVACDMLTRTSKDSDVAPDVSVYPRARDRRTGGRQLEQLAFEVVSTQTLRDAGRKAAKLSARGVRRVFAIDVKRTRALEWSKARGAWRELNTHTFIKDRVFATPLSIEALVQAAEVDDAVARALLRKRNPVLEAAKSKARAAGRRKGLAEGVAEGKRQGLAEGQRKGLAKGKRQGLAEGLARGRAQALLALVKARGIALGRADRARILGERDPAVLARWIARAATCTGIAAVFRKA
jgi:Uma2 family endonuclease